MEEETGNVNREMKILRKNQKEILETKNKCNKMRTIFDGLIIRLNMLRKELLRLKK
jgi:hypothetical protein